MERVALLGINLEGGLSTLSSVWGAVRARFLHWFELVWCPKTGLYSVAEMQHAISKMGLQTSGPHNGSEWSDERLVAFPLNGAILSILPQVGHHNC
ncbi:unnamed protein product [Sympodiomycopsis kandeliae]